MQMLFPEVAGVPPRVMLAVPSRSENKTGAMKSESDPVVFSISLQLS